MFESLEENSTVQVANNITYQNDSKICKAISKFRLYVEIKNIMK